MKKLFGALPQELGTLHFVGIGGAGMSSLAEMLHSSGFKIQGSDTVDNNAIQRLKKLGVKIFPRHKAENIKGVALVVRSTAIPDDNPEIVAANKAEVTIQHRSELLAEVIAEHAVGVAVTGTHGKSTTTALIYSLFKTAKLHAGVIAGSMINSLQGSATVGGGKIMVAESDESDGTFTNMRPKIGVITNIDREHMDYYHTMDNMLQSYQQFLHNITDKGIAVICADNQLSYELAKSHKAHNSNGCRVITYGLRDDVAVDVFASNVRQEKLTMFFDLTLDGKTYGDIKLNLAGTYNVMNALAAISVVYSLGVKVENILDGLSDFQGVNRRMNVLGEFKDITVIDDYAHHPTEVEVALQAVRKAYRNRKVIAVIQPHRYTRLKDNMEGFVKSVKGIDKVVVTPVFEAGESPISGINHHTLAEKISEAYMPKPKSAYTVENSEDLAKKITSIAGQGDVVVCMGAGSITRWAADLVKYIKLNG